MRKALAFVLTLAMSASLLVGCTVKIVVIDNPTGNVENVEMAETTEDAETTEGAVKTGLSVIAGLSGEGATAESNGAVTTDISLVAVTVNDKGVIESCAIDAVQGKVAFDQEGQLAAETGEILSKNELGDNYGMRVASPIGKEWNEQAAHIAAYAVGKTVEELKTKAIDENGVVADADLASGATIYMGSFIWAIEAAVNNATHLGAESGDQLILTAISSNGSTAASAEAEGSASVTSNILAMTTRENVITSCIIDAVQSKAAFDIKGQLVGEVGGDVLSKAQLGADYGLKAYSGIGKEWNEQTAAFCEYVTGKTIEEVQNIALTETTAPADADLAASVSIAVGDFMGLVEKLAK